MKLRIINKPKLIAQFQSEPRDWWIGWFWQREEIALHLYVCFIPLVTIATPN